MALFSACLGRVEWTGRLLCLIYTHASPKHAPSFSFILVHTKDTAIFGREDSLSFILRSGQPQLNHHAHFGTNIDYTQFKHSLDLQPSRLTFLNPIELSP